MPRASRARKLFPIAVTASELAYQLRKPLRVIREAVRLGELEMYQHGVQRLILVEDAVRWVRSTWKRVK